MMEKYEDRFMAEYKTFGEKNQVMNSHPSASIISNDDDSKQNDKS